MMPHIPYVIAVDGPAASGKGTLARRVAARFSLVHLDTGLLYRYVGSRVLREDPLLLSNPEYAVKVAESVKPQNLNPLELASEEVGRAASIVSAYPEVRQALLAVQKQVAADPKGAVLDGRDIGTVICPGADFKFYITADIAERAKRRYKELQSRGKAVIYDAVLEDLKQRDTRDSQRAIAPLKPAPDAIHIDSSGMDSDAVFNAVLSHILGAK